MKTGRLPRLLLAVAMSCSATACSSIGTINGVRMNATTAPEETYCERHRIRCILGAAFFIGGATALMLSNDHDHPRRNNGSPGSNGSPPPGNSPPPPSEGAPPESPSEPSLD